MPEPRPIELPGSLREQLLGYRRRLWTVKLGEALAAAASGVLLGFLLVFLADRFFDSPPALRGLLLIAALVACAAIPLAFRRWVWRRRTPDQLARLLARTHPRIGEPLLSAIQLAASPSEQARSPKLVAAAIGQVAEATRQRDLARTVSPTSRRRRGLIAGLLAVLAGGLFLGIRPASVNAWARFLAPWRDVPRYTFVSIEDLPDEIVVAHGEPFEFHVTLTDTSAWRPPEADLRTPLGQIVTAPRHQRGYTFRVPGLIETGELDVRVGDRFQRLTARPVVRPELTSLELDVELPDYLGRQQNLRQPLRGNVTTAVSGSRLRVNATASRDLASASVNTAPASISPERSGGDRFTSEAVRLDDPVAFRMRWRDRFGLTGKDDFTLTVEPAEDQPPSVRFDGLVTEQWILEDDVIEFDVSAADDFGIRRVGFEWSTLDPNADPEAEPDIAWDERMLAAGDPDAERMEFKATLSPSDLGVEPQPLAVRVFAEDYLPDRPRVYTPATLLRVVTTEQHARRIAEELRRWQRLSRDVRDRERQLHERNRELRELSDEELNRPEIRHELLRQASEERGGARQLRELVDSGERLLRESMRNPDTPADSVASMARTIRSLEQIAEDRMPSVADLLQQASRAPGGGKDDGTNTNGDPPPTDAADPNAADPDATNDDTTDADASGSSSAGNGSEPNEPDDPKPDRNLSDVETGHRPIDPATAPDNPNANDPDAEKPDADKPPDADPTLSLPSTMIAGGAKTSEPSAERRAIDDAVREQSALLAEFDEIAGELSEAMDALEGSTFVKRLKAASRAQTRLAESLRPLATVNFAPNGNRVSPNGNRQPEIAESLRDLANRQSREADRLDNLRSDMAAYHARTLTLPYRSVLMQIRTENLVGGIRDLATRLHRQPALSIALAEYWSDTLDRWADDLVPVAKSEKSDEDSPPADSLPPAILLEVLRVLDGEVKLREQTRVAEQARPAVEPPEHTAQARRLADRQQALRDRVSEIVRQLDAFADEEIDFTAESALMSTVGKLMGESRRLLGAGETGPLAIAVQTESIELMLQSNRFNPSGGGSGGGGSSPGGGGGGTTDAEALARLGAGAAAEKVESEPRTRQLSGRAGTDLPEEFRSGLNEYFNRVDTWGSR